MYRLVFQSKTCGYRCHVEGCSAARTDRRGRLLEDQFKDIEAAHAFADADEREKGGDFASFKICDCAKRQTISDKDYLASCQEASRSETAFERAEDAATRHASIR